MKIFRTTLILCFLLACGAMSFAEPVKAPEKVLVAVASNFVDVNTKLAAQFQMKTGIVVESSSGSTGKLFAQIENGAPFQIFLSADVEHVEKLEKDGMSVKGSRVTYAIGKLALYSASLPGVKDGALLKSDAVKHLAIADPALAPYGSAAVQYLKSINLWEGLKDHVVVGENIAQTLQFAHQGAAEAALVAYSQVLNEPAEKVWLVPPTMYPELKQEAALLKPGASSAAAKAYLAFLRGPEARALIEAGGYSVGK